MEMHDLRSAVEGDFAVDAEGKLRGVVVRIVQGEGIVVWAGELEEHARQKASVEIQASDFVMRSVVHFVNWSSVQSYYANTPFANLLESIRARTLRFSTVAPTNSARQS